MTNKPLHFPLPIAGIVSFTYQSQVMKNHFLPDKDRGDSSERKRPEEIPLKLSKLIGNWIAHYLTSSQVKLRLPS